MVKNSLLQAGRALNL